jgi:hypothetical protein
MFETPHRSLLPLPWCSWSFCCSKRKLRAICHACCILEYYSKKYSVGSAYSLTKVARLSQIAQCVSCPCRCVLIFIGVLFRYVKTPYMMDLVRHTLLGGGVLSLPDVCSYLTGRLTKWPAHRLVKQAESHGLQHLLQAFQRGKKQFPGSTRNTTCAYITDPVELVEIIYELRIHHQRSSEKARNRQVSSEELCQRIDKFLETFPQTFPDLWAGHDINGLYTERGLVIGFKNNFTTSSTNNGQNDHTTNVRVSTTLCRCCFL